MCAAQFAGFDGIGSEYFEDDMDAVSVYSFAKEIAASPQDLDPNDIIAGEYTMALAQVPGAMKARNIRSLRNAASGVLDAVHDQVGTKGIHLAVALKQPVEPSEEAKN